MSGAPIRCASCTSFMAHDLANNQIFCANPMCVQSNCEGQSRTGEWFCPNCERHHPAGSECPIATTDQHRVEGTLWCPDCQRPFPRGSNHECPPKGVPSEAECRAADAGKLVVGNFGGDPYKLNGELAEKIGLIIDSYQGRISLAAVMGVLEITKINLWSKHNA